MLSAPLLIRGEHQYPGDEADRVIDLGPRGEAAVGTVVHDDEGADQEATDEEYEQRGRPWRRLHQPVGHIERRDQRREVECELPERPGHLGIRVAGHDPTPLGRIELGRHQLITVTEVDDEDENRVRRNAIRALRTVAEARRDDQLTSATRPHPLEPFIEAGDHRTGPSAERSDRPSVELHAIAERAGVPHRHRLGGIRGIQGAGPYGQVTVVEPRGGLGRGGEIHLERGRELGLRDIRNEDGIATTRGERDEEAQGPS